MNSFFEVDCYFELADELVVLVLGDLKLSVKVYVKFVVNLRVKRRDDALFDGAVGR